MDSSNFRADFYHCAADIITGGSAAGWIYERFSLLSVKWRLFVSTLSQCSRLIIKPALPIAIMNECFFFFLFFLSGSKSLCCFLGEVNCSAGSCLDFKIVRNLSVPVVAALPRKSRTDP